MFICLFECYSKYNFIKATVLSNLNLPDRNNEKCYSYKKSVYFL